MISVCAAPVSRSTADCASIGSVVMDSQSTGTGTRSLRAKPRVTWAFSCSACLQVFKA